MLFTYEPFNHQVLTHRSNALRSRFHHGLHGPHGSFHARRLWTDVRISDRGRFLAIKEIYKNHKAEALTKEDHSKDWKLLFVSLFLLADFEFLLYFLDYQGVISDLATTNYVLSKVVYAVLCIGTGISGALLMKAGVLEYCGSTRYAQLNWTVRAAFLLLWFTVWSTIHF